MDVAAVVHDAGTFVSRDGGTVAWRSTMPTQAEVKAVLTMQMGTLGTPEAFDQMADKLARKGIASYAVGTRSDGADQLVYAEDLDRVHQMARADFPGVPQAVAGASAGASIALQWAVRHNADGAAVAALAPVAVPKFMTASDFAKVGAAFVSRDAGKALVNTPMSRGIPLTTNPDSLEAGVAATSDQRVPANFFADVMRMNMSATVHSAAIDEPLLLGWAGKDQVNATGLSKLWSHTVSSGMRAGQTIWHSGSSAPKVTRATFKTAAHDLSQESNHADVVNTLSSWVLANAS